MNEQQPEEINVQLDGDRETRAGRFTNGNSIRALENGIAQLDFFMIDSDPKSNNERMEVTGIHQARIIISHEGLRNLQNAIISFLKATQE